MNFETSDKQKTIETDYLNVKGNLINWKGTIIQISNISKISINEVERKPFPIYALLLILLALLILNSLPLIAVIFAFVGFFWVCYYFYKINKLAELKILSFKLNSGDRFGIVFNNQDFLNKVMSVLTEILSEDTKSSNITFDIKNNTYDFKDNVFNDSSSAVNNEYKGEWNANK